jgi:hypothetical protein
MFYRCYNSEHRRASRRRVEEVSDLSAPEPAACYPWLVPSSLLAANRSPALRYASLRRRHRQAQTLRETSLRKGLKALAERATTGAAARAPRKRATAPAKAPRKGHCGDRGRDTAAKRARVTALVPHVKPPRAGRAARNPRPASERHNRNSIADINRSSAKRPRTRVGGPNLRKTTSSPSRPRSPADPLRRRQRSARGRGPHLLPTSLQDCGQYAPH